MRQEINELSDFLTSFTGIRTYKLNLLIMSLAFFTAKMEIIFADSFFVFFAITAVVLLDFVFGVVANINNFRTSKALKVVWYLGGYWAIGALCLILEAAFITASWLTETIVFTILFFQLISILKNAAKCGLISNSVLKQLLSKVDKHKDILEDEQKN